MVNAQPGWKTSKAKITQCWNDIWRPGSGIIHDLFGQVALLVLDIFPMFFLLISLLYNWPMHRDFMKIKFDKNESGHLACETSSPNPLNLKMAVKLVLCAFLSHIWGFRQHFKRQTFSSFSASLHTSRSRSRSSATSSFWQSPSRVTLQTSAITIIISAPFNHYS